MNISDNEFNAYRATEDYRKFLAGILEHSGSSVRKAQAALNDAERSRRIDAAIAVRAGYGKTATANRLGISRPTLDAWLHAVNADADETAAVEEHEAFVRRQLKDGKLQPL